MLLLRSALIKLHWNNKTRYLTSTRAWPYHTLMLCPINQSKPAPTDHLEKSVFAPSWPLDNANKPCDSRFLFIFARNRTTNQKHLLWFARLRIPIAFAQWRRIALIVQRHNRTLAINSANTHRPSDQHTSQGEVILEFEPEFWLTLPDFLSSTERMIFVVWLSPRQRSNAHKWQRGRGEGGRGWRTRS